MANEKDLKNLNADNKKMVSGGTVYYADNKFYVPCRDGYGNIEIFQNEKEAVEFSRQQGWDNNDVVKCDSEFKAIEECGADAMTYLYDESIN